MTGINCCDRSKSQ